MREQEGTTVLAAVLASNDELGIRDCPVRLALLALPVCLLHADDAGTRVKASATMEALLKSVCM